MEKIKKLRKILNKELIDGYLIPKGLIPLPSAEQAKYFKHGKELTKFDPNWLKKEK